MKQGAKKDKIDLKSMVKEKKFFANMLYLGQANGTKFYFDWRTHFASFGMYSKYLYFFSYFLAGKYIIAIIYFLLIELIKVIHELGHLTMSKLFESKNVKCSELFFGGKGGACLISGMEYLNLDQKILISFGGVLFQILYNFCFLAVIHIFPSPTIILLYKKITILNLLGVLLNTLPILKGSDGTDIFILMYNELLYKQTRLKIETKYPIFSYIISYLRGY